MTLIVAFYSGQGLDHRGRPLAEVQQWPDEKLEAVHDYIQWMFPLREPSAFNPQAPLLDEETIQAFRSRPDLQEYLRASFIRMLRFYGLDLVSVPRLEVVEAGNFTERSSDWLIPYNHNHLRITRILKSLRTLGLEHEADAFFHRLAEIHHAGPRMITAETFRFWRSAAGL
jgi:hypothetical protein